MVFDLQRFTDALISNTMRFGTDKFNLFGNQTDTVPGGEDTVPGGEDTVPATVEGAPRIMFYLKGQTYYVQLIKEV